MSWKKNFSIRFGAGSPDKALFAYQVNTKPHQNKEILACRSVQALSTVLNLSVQFTPYLFATCYNRGTLSHLVSSPFSRQQPSVLSQVSPFLILWQPNLSHFPSKMAPFQLILDTCSVPPAYSLLPVARSRSSKKDPLALSLHPLSGIPPQCADYPSHIRCQNLHY